MRTKSSRGGGANDPLPSLKKNSDTLNCTVKREFNVEIPSLFLYFSFVETIMAE